MISVKSAIVATFVASTTLAAIISPAAAHDYPYCLQGKQLGYPGSCEFETFQQCQATASGTDSACGINPMVAFARQGRNPHEHNSLNYPAR
jgi:hypothetical protein